MLAAGIGSGNMYRPITADYVRVNDWTLFKRSSPADQLLDVAHCLLGISGGKPVNVSRRELQYATSMTCNAIRQYFSRPAASHMDIPR